ncbi:Acetylcholine receptor subunit alpha [Apis cerana cerana]|uniref:Acetylcholine receptor subunit alpha n=1 Tax=Apis cerana cerana TaxID=94128 RepID=A0A2A3E4D2_APICC|nr:Acetylcholine receptor subunit alpha [Apis cerana cerana]
MNKKLPRRIGKIEKMIVRLLFFFPESEKSNHDNEPLGRTVMVRLQVKMGSKGIWWGGNAARAIRSYMEARYSFVQQVDLRHIDEIRGSNVVDIGVDLSEFYTSVEWDILEVPAVRNEKFYTCCDEPYLDITFNITMRRKTLFYTVNLIIPCMGISFLTVLVFYLPSDSGEKYMRNRGSPQCSLPVATDTRDGTMGPSCFYSCSAKTTGDAQIDKRSMGSHHGQRVMVRTCNGLELRDPSLFVETSASELVESSVLFPSLDSRDELHPRELEAVNLGSACRIHGSPATTAAPPPQLPTEESVDALCNTLHHWHHCPEIYKAIEGIRFIADHTKREEDSTRVKEDWKYVAMVLDRLFLWIFTLAVVVGTAGIILQAPTLYDDRIPIDVRLSEIASTTAKPHIVTSL